MRTLAILILLSSTAYPCSRCGYYGSACRYTAAPSYHQNYSYPYTDHRFQVTYNITAPLPAAAGSTLYQYQQYPYLDPALYLNAASRYLELSQDTSRRGFESFSQTATLQLQGQAQIAELQAKTQLYEQLSKFAAPLAAGGSITLRASRDATGRLTLEQSGPLAATDRFSETLRTHCASCHKPGGRKPEPDLSDLANLDLGKWGAEIVYRVTTKGKDVMPPVDQPPLSVEQQNEIAGRIVAEMRRQSREAQPPLRGPKE